MLGVPGMAILHKKTPVKRFLKKKITKIHISKKNIFILLMLLFFLLYNTILEINYTKFHNHHLNSKLSRGQNMIFALGGPWKTMFWAGKNKFTRSCN